MKRLVVAIGRRPRTTLALMLTISLVALAGLPRVTFDSSLASLTVADDPARLFNEAVRTKFGDEEIGVVALLAPDVYTVELVEGLRELTDSLAAVKGVSRTLSLTNANDPPADVFDPPTLLPPGAVTPATVAHLRSRVAANPIYVPNLVNADGTAAAVAVFFRYAATAADEAAVDLAIRDALAEYDGPGTLHYTGMSHVRVRAAEQMQGDLRVFLPISLLVMMAVLWLLFRSGKATVLPLLAVALGVGCLMGTMGWLGVPVTMTTLVLPSLLLVIGGSYSVHVVSTFLDIRRRDEEASASTETMLLALIERVGLPVMVSAATTAVGFGSLAIHPIPAIAGLGKFAVVGIAMVAGGALFGVPLTFLSLPSRWRTDFLGPADDEGPLPAIDRALLRVCAYAIDHRPLVIVASLAIVGLSVAGATHIRSDTNFLKAFRASSDVRQAHDAITENLVGPTPVSVIVTGPEEGYFRSVVALRRIKDLQDFLLGIDVVDASVSLVDYFDELDLGLQAAPGGIDVDDEGNLIELPPPASFWDDPEAQLPQILQLVSASPRTFKGLVDSEFREVNLTLRTSISGSSQVRELEDEIARYTEAMLPRGIEVRLTGGMVIMAAASERVISGQVESIAVALTVILLALAVMFLSFRVALAALIPNVLPIVTFFGVMGWVGVELNLATSIVGAVALGIAVDDTIHYMARLNALVKTAPTQRDALLETLQTVGRAVVATSLTLTAGFLVMAASGFAIIAAFGWLAALTMMVALATNVILLPAILATVPVVSVWDLASSRLGPSPHTEIPLFEGVGRLGVRLIVLLGKLRTFEAGSYVVRRGEPGEEMYLVLDGLAQVQLGGGTSIPLKRGGIVGEMGLLRRTPRGADVVAETDVEVLVIDEAFLRRLRIRYPRIASLFFINIARILSDRLDAANKRTWNPRPAGAFTPAKPA